jgi:polar amino acid transport system substrate-binding protein
MRILQWLAVAGALGWSAHALAADPLDTIVRKGTLRVCTADFAPYAFKDARGEWSGREVDMAKRLASDLGVRAGFVERRFVQLIPTLAAGGCDLIAASMSIEPERLRRVWFSRPYSDSEVRVVVRKQGAATALASLDQPGVTVAAVDGTVAVGAVKDMLPSARVQRYANLAAARQALEDGAVAGLAHSTPVPALLVAEAPERFAVAEGAPLLRTAEAFAVKKGNSDLLNYVNGWIETRLRDGFLERSDAYWLNGLQWIKRVPAVAKAP